MSEDEYEDRFDFLVAELESIILEIEVEREMLNDQSFIEDGQANTV